MHSYILYGLLSTLILLVYVRCRQNSNSDQGHPENGIFYNIEIRSEEKERDFKDLTIEPDEPAGQIILRKDAKLAYPPPLKTVTSDILPHDPKAIEQIYIRYGDYYIHIDEITCKLGDMKSVVDEFLENGWFIAGSLFARGSEKLYDPDSSVDQHRATRGATLDPWTD
ncbi:MAG: hypothetical protein N0C84_22505 [Candidatus Thiodiazotropha taylori]|uniref:Uncharacterized protein n=1 Tax=Candidatus Thiodiazotropha taylori TaxID=2792791 RepID=A0A9E4T8V4_9GAMM|nr:hypothetical protein [Candidatus Thiodiazotropha taylori]MCW4259240.1 hypothetical protein [Candidatus Thiodiazotropha taylori]